MTRIGRAAGIGAALVLGLAAAQRLAVANGGPFVVKYPGGDPAAKGALARISPDLRPAREERLRVVREDLEIVFTNDYFLSAQDAAPLARVTAAYRIANPTAEAVTMDFGFPILRGIYMNPMSMMPSPDVSVRVDGKYTPVQVISNSNIYQMIRVRAREAVDAALKGDARLAALVDGLRQAPDDRRESARQALAGHLRDTLKWDDRDAALLAEYASADLPAETLAEGPVRPFHFGYPIRINVGFLGAIGERKATQFLAHLAAKLRPGAAMDYEALFAAWGGDVRERAVDLATGRVRPREFAFDAAAQQAADNGRRWETTAVDDFGIYARVDYLDPKVPLTDRQKEACRTILKNLPVTFTFAPMNLLYYQVVFPPQSEQTVTVSYAQHACKDTGAPASHQLAYVLHPASLWKEFGPIHLTIKAPEAAALRASVPLERAGTERIKIRRLRATSPSSATVQETDCGYAIHRAVLAEKTGELFVGIDAEGWKRSTTLALSSPQGQQANVR